MLSKALCALLITLLLAGCSPQVQENLAAPAQLEADTPAPVEAALSPEQELSPEQQIEAAVNDAILAYNQGLYAAGETQTEGHVIFDTVRNGDDRVIAYCIVSYGEFGFENGIFTKVSGSGAIPTAITLSRDGQGGYALAEYKEMPDGGSYADIFPEDVVPGDLAEYYGGLLQQQEEQAKEYLAAIGREGAQVSGSYVEKILSTSLGMDVEASNELLHLFAEYPYWIGTLERLEDGVRYIYRKAYDADSGIVTFTKEKEDGAAVERYVIDTTGGELVFLEGNQRP